MIFILWVWRSCNSPRLLPSHFAGGLNSIIETYSSSSMTWVVSSWSRCLAREIPVSRSGEITRSAPIFKRTSLVVLLLALATTFGMPKDLQWRTAKTLASKLLPVAITTVSQVSIPAARKRSLSEISPTTPRVKMDSNWLIWFSWSSTAMILQLYLQRVFAILVPKIPRPNIPMVCFCIIEKYSFYKQGCEVLGYLVFKIVLP